MARKTADETEKTRERILSAAEEVFTNAGFQGASMSDIAERAGVTKSLLHHHFESKQGLWDAARGRLLGGYAEEQRRTFVSAEGGAQFVRQSFTAYFRFLRDHPQFLRMLLWTQAERGASYDTGRDPQTGELARQLVDEGTERMLAMQQRGELRSDFDPRFINACFLGMLRQWFVLRQDFFSGAEDQRVLDDEYLHTAISLFWEGVRPR